MLRPMFLECGHVDAQQTYGQMCILATCRAAHAQPSGWQLKSAEGYKEQRFQSLAFSKSV